MILSSILATLLLGTTPQVDAVEFSKGDDHLKKQSTSNQSSLPPAEIHAASNPTSEPKDTKSTTPQNKSTPSKSPTNEKMPCSYKKNTHRFGRGWQLRISPLYWNATQEVTEFLVLPSDPLSSRSQNLYREAVGNYKSANVDWAPGVRVSLDHVFTRDFWRLTGEYTYFFSSGTQSYGKPAPDIFIEATFPDLTVNGLQSAKSYIDILYNNAEVLVSRCFFPTEQILVDLAMGVTTQWLSQHWTIDYLATQDTVVKNNWTFTGGGVELKESGRWHIGSQFEITELMGFSLLLGHYTNLNKIYFTPPFDAGTANFLNPFRETTYNKNIVVPFLQTSLGFRWNCCINPIAFDIGVAFETNTWINLQKVFKDFLSNYTITGANVNEMSVSSVSLYGLTFDIGVKF